VARRPRVPASDAASVRVPLWPGRFQNQRDYRGALRMYEIFRNHLATVTYRDDGRLLHTELRTGVRHLSRRSWQDLQTAQTALDNGLGDLEWDKLPYPLAKARP